MSDMHKTEYSDAISSVEEIIDDARNGRMFILVDHEDRENEGDLVIPAQMCTPVGHQLHGDARAGSDLPRAAGNADRCARPAADEPQELQPPRDRLHPVDRGARRGDDRHLGRRPGADRLGRHRPDEGCGRHRDTRPHLSAARPRRRRAGPRRPYRGGGGRGASRGPQPLGRDLRDHERGRHDGAPARPRRLRAEAQAEDRHDLGPDRLSPPPRQSGQREGGEACDLGLWRRLADAGLCRRDAGGRAHRPEQGRPQRAGAGAGPDARAQSAGGCAGDQPRSRGRVARRDADHRARGARRGRAACATPR